MRRLCALVATLAWLLGCTDGPVEVLSQAPPSFYEDVAPSFARSCWCCHRSGGVGPSLLTAQETEVHFEEVLASLEEGTMPPMPEGPSPVTGCDTIRRQAPPMTTAEIRTLVAWADGGYRAGDPATAPEVPTSCWPVPEGETLEIRLPEQGLVGPERVERRCFRLGIPQRPGTAVVHGRLVQAPATFRSITVLVNPYVTETTVGSSDCDGAFDAWAYRVIAGLWGDDDVMELPAGSGIVIPADRTMSATVIYDNAFAEGDFTSKPIILELTTVPVETLETPLQVAHIDSTDFPLDPGGEAVASKVEEFGGRLQVAGVVGQMNDLGSSLSIVLGPEEVPSCTVEQRDWKPRDVRPLLFDPPIRDLRRAGITCTFDLRGVTEPVEWGSPPEGETCLLSLLVAP